MGLCGRGHPWSGGWLTSTASSWANTSSTRGDWVAIMVPTTLFIVENIPSLTRSLIHSFTQNPRLMWGSQVAWWPELMESFRRTVLVVVGGGLRA